MANEEQLALLKQGVREWNIWRQNNATRQPDLQEVDLQGADLRRANLRGANLRGANLRGTDLRGTDLREADLQGADLREADLFGAILQGAILRRADLRGTHLRGTHLQEAILQEAILQETILQGANLQGAILQGAILQGAILRRADLQGADLRAADLRAADLQGADLQGAILNLAIVGETVFGDIDLSQVQGLETVQHRAPSTVGINTLHRSHGKIPPAFLRGCGVPDSWIEYLPSLIGALEPIQFYSCFISYSSNDEAFAKHLHGRMQQEHLRVWFAPENMKGGEKIHEQIDQAIRLHDKLVLILSEQSIQSEWVITEIRKARKAELRDNRRKLFPIGLVDFNTLRDWECFDADIGKDLAVEIREYFIPDFSDWKDHDAFEATFTRLLRDLKAVNAPPAQSTDTASQQLGHDD